jgi:hypothetical protein
MTNPLDLQDLPEENAPEAAAAGGGACISVVSVVNNKDQ